MGWEVDEVGRSFSFGSLLPSIMTFLCSFHFSSFLVSWTTPRHDFLLFRLISILFVRSSVHLSGAKHRISA